MWHNLLIPYTPRACQTIRRLKTPTACRLQTHLVMSKTASRAACYAVEGELSEVSTQPSDVLAQCILSCTQVHHSVRLPVHPLSCEHKATRVLLSCRIKAFLGVTAKARSWGRPRGFISVLRCRTACSSPVSASAAKGWTCMRSSLNPIARLAQHLPSAVLC